MPVMSSKKAVHTGFDGNFNLHRRYRQNIAKPLFVG